MTVNKPHTPADKPEILAERVFDAPRELVFNAWSDPVGISNWWGPRGFTTTTHEMQFKEGGVWRFTMHGPDGVDYPNKITYTEIVVPERIAYDHTGEGDYTDHRFRVVVTLSAENGKTRMAFRMIFDTLAERDHVMEFGASEGLSDTLERLSEHLAG